MRGTWCEVGTGGSAEAISGRLWMAAATAVVQARGDGGLEVTVHSGDRRPGEICH